MATPSVSASGSSPRPIYLDCHATTPCDPRVVESMLPFFSEQFGNPASISHQYGQDARDAVERARRQVADFCHVDIDSVIFTSGATEANNLAIKGAATAAGRIRHAGSLSMVSRSGAVDQTSTSSRPHLITTAVEHRAVLDPVRRLSRQGFDITILPADEFGRVAPESVAEALRESTVLVSVMLVNNEVGTINAIPGIASICHDAGVVFHCDAVQAAGRIDIDVPRLGADLLSLSAHKVYGPKGIGALIVRRDGRRIPIDPLFDGGGHEQHLRSGTLPVPLIVGMGTALDVAAQSREEETRRIAGQRDRLWQRLQTSLDGLLLNGHSTERVAGNLNVSFAGIDGDVLMNSMTRIAVSSGSACTSANPEPSHVLRAIGRSDVLTRASLRFGLGRFTTDADIECAADFVIATVNRLRGSSSTVNHG